MAFKQSILFIFAFILYTVSAIEILNVTIERQENVYPEENPADLIDLSTIHQTESVSSNNEDAEFAVEKYQTGFARVVRVGVTVQKGTRGNLNFRIRARGVDSETISNSDASFSEVAKNTLTQEQFNTYQELKKSFSGSLNIPLLEFLGYNFNKNLATSQQDAQAKFNSLGSSEYNALSSEASKVLDSFTDTKVTISGSLQAVGVSFIPTTAFAFLKFSRVEFGENQSTNVFSSTTNDLVSATNGGRTVPSDNKDIQILSPVRR